MLTAISARLPATTCASRSPAPGPLRGSATAIPTTIESFQADHRRAFNGLALVIVRAARGQAGQIAIGAEADGLAAGRTVITAARR